MITMTCDHYAVFLYLVNYYRCLAIKTRPLGIKFFCVNPVFGILYSTNFSTMATLAQRAQAQYCYWFWVAIATKFKTQFDIFYHYET